MLLLVPYWDPAKSFEGPLVVDESIEVTPRNASDERAFGRLLFPLHFHSFLEAV